MEQETFNQSQEKPKKVATTKVFHFLQNFKRFLLCSLADTRTLWIKRKRSVALINNNAGLQIIVLFETLWEISINRDGKLTNGCNKLKYWLFISFYSTELTYNTNSPKNSPISRTFNNKSPFICMNALSR